jgi:diacylglycerol kinase family enzyme
MRATAILGSLAGALRGGGVRPSEHLDLRTDLTELTITPAATDLPFPYQVDGDFLGETRELRFRHRPDAVRLVRPAPAP